MAPKVNSLYAIPFILNLKIKSSVYSDLLLCLPSFLFIFEACVYAFCIPLNILNSRILQIALIELHKLLFEGYTNNIQCLIPVDV